MAAWTQEHNTARIFMAPSERVVYGSRKALVSTVATLSEGVSCLTARRGQLGFYRLTHSLETPGGLRRKHQTRKRLGARPLVTRMRLSWLDHAQKFGENLSRPYWRANLKRGCLSSESRGKAESVNLQKDEETIYDRLRHSRLCSFVGKRVC